jgi:hypothetical protein
MSERVVKAGQGWTTDVGGVVTEIGFYIALISLVTLLSICVPA